MGTLTDTTTVDAADVEKMLKSERKAHAAEIKELDAEAARLRALLDVTAAVTEHRGRPIVWKPGRRKAGRGRAVVTAILSDLHLDEVVRPDEMGGVNAYDRRIAEQRLGRWVDKVTTLPREYMAGVDYDGAALFLAGDLLSGDIHDELRKTNAGTLAEGIAYWVDPLSKAVGALADEYGKVTVDVVAGNHGRNPLNRRSPAKGRARDNFDTLIGWLIARDFADDPRVEVHVELSTDAHRTIYNCVAVGTRVLTRDLRWVDAASLKAGDELFGFDADLGDGAGRERTRRWRPSTVLHADRRTQPGVRVDLADGSSITCTPDHPLLCGTSYGNVTRWVKASDIRPGWTLRRYLDPWDADTSYDAGWLAGMLDGEGSVSTTENKRSIQVRVHQNAGPTADRLLSLLEERIAVSVDDDRRCRGFTAKGPLAEQLRLLGSLRPGRLLYKVADWLEGSGSSLQAIGDVEVLSVTPVDAADIVVLGTTTETYFTEGFGSHNTRYLVNHGDNAKGGSGIAGALSPLMLFNARKGKVTSATDRSYDLMVLGHWHQLMLLPGKGLIVNGSLKGYDEYAATMSFDFEPPQQGLWLTTPEHGVTLTMPILVQDRKAEKW